MVNNKRGQMIFFGIMIGIMIFITMVIMTPAMKDAVELARDANHLDCDAAGLTVGVEATCILVGMWLFYFVGTAIALSVGAIGMRKFTQ